MQPVHSGALVTYLRARHQTLRRALANSVGGLDRDAQAALRGLIVWVSLATHASARAEARLPQASLARDPSHPLDGWRAWRAARRASSGRGFRGRA